MSQAREYAKLGHKMALGVTGMILGFQLAAPEHTMAQAAARSLVLSILASGCRPAVIKVDSLNLICALQTLADALGPKLLQAKSLPRANEARSSMEAFSSRF
jgi:hypothetical protein